MASLKRKRREFFRSRAIFHCQLRAEVKNALFLDSMPRHFHFLRRDRKNVIVVRPIATGGRPFVRRPQNFTYISICAAAEKERKETVTMSLLRAAKINVTRGSRGARTCVMETSKKELRLCLFFLALHSLISSKQAPYVLRTHYVCDKSAQSSY